MGPENKVATKYLLSASMIEGSELDSAAAVIPQSQVNYVVSLDFNGDGTKKFADISEALVGTEKQFAVVLDGQVLSAPTMDALITNGQAQIEGNFTQDSRQEPRDQPQVRRAAGLVLRLQRRDGRALAGR